ncbi:sugar-binding domain-containing protein [uncultured Desulfobulbus sp.]|uniref:beta-mannosidase n=1 Tax=uncultured Desulfobulbus sp. TaxID=239745 RepID=UPI0029C76F89|nr:sugar-binding domain-containing protein [uncultured Desulfobulbus sp.]
MLSKLDLNGKWKVKGFDGQHGQPEGFISAGADERTFITAQVPGDVHLDLEAAGLIGDVNIGMNAQSARWVEEQIWVYRTRFDAPADAVAQNAWLVFEGLDLNAVIYLNGQEIGRHNDFYTPCRINVTGKLVEGENLLCVRIESGLYGVADKPGAPYCPGLPDQLSKRSWLRKPQSSFSWDWSPRLINVGIWRPVHLEWTNSARIDAVTVYPELADDHKSAKIHTRVFIDNPTAEPIKAKIRMKVPDISAVVDIDVELPAGVSRHDLAVDVDNPKLWWPRPHGDQPLYNVKIKVLVDDQVVDIAKRRTGIRSIGICQDPHPETGEYFILQVNGASIFAKGGNWVHPDIIFAETSAERYRKLVELAVDANFNALRIWGGAMYTDHAFLDACDELGVMVWHDLIFACAKYPGDDGEFNQLVRDEVTHIVRDLSPHPSLLVWCGNNELEWVYPYWDFQKSKPLPDHSLFHFYFPRIMAEEDPSRPYWPSSPYSTNHREPNDRTTGDQHPWNVSLQGEGPNFWHYRGDVSRFPNEGGVLGASSPATLRQFLPADQQYLRSPSWEFHDNACNYWVDNLCYSAVDYWVGKKADELALDDYVFYSGVLQGEGLQEYANNFRRRMFSSSSAIFWMYNDTWPASHGWTIVDYYNRRKMAYHPVRRAFEPIRIIPAVDGDVVKIFGVNDTLETWQGKAVYGIFQMAGGLPINKSVDVTLVPNAAIVIDEISLADWKAIGEDVSGVFGILYKDGEPVSQNRLFVTKFKDLKWAKPEVSIERRGDKAIFRSPVFVWGVCLDIDGEAPVTDDIFDLLPGIEYEMAWPSDQPLPVIQRYASL